MKKLISLLAAAAMLLGTSAAVLADAQNNSPSVYVDNTEILFADQAPVIVDDRTLIPVRGVFEALDCRVVWMGEEQMVAIESPYNIKRIFLTIGSDQMRVLTYKTITESDESFVTLDVPAQIMNDRTMIPFRAISEALGHEVSWDNEAYSVLIKTAKDANASTDASEEKKLSVSLSTDVSEVKAGDEVVVDLKLDNLDLYPNTFVSGITASVTYDKENFDFVEAYMCDENGENFGAMGASNPDYTADSLKVVYVTIDSETAMKTDGTVMKLVFKAKNDAKGTFKLADRYNTKLGYDTTILVDDGTNGKTIQGENLVVDTTPVAVNADAVVEPDVKTTEDATTEVTVEDEFIEDIDVVIEEQTGEDEAIEDEVVEDEIIEDEVIEDEIIEDESMDLDEDYVEE